MDKPHLQISCARMNKPELKKNEILKWHKFISCLLTKVTYILANCFSTYKLASCLIVQTREISNCLTQTTYLLGHIVKLSIVLFVTDISSIKGQLNKHFDNFSLAILRIFLSKKTTYKTDKWTKYSAWRKRNFMLVNKLHAGSYTQL